MGVTFELGIEETQPPASRSWWARCAKLFLDYSIVLPGLIFISPVLVLLAVLIKLDSPGPVIYRRRVLGLHGRPFDAYKFRTMVVNGDEILARYPKLRTELQRHQKLPNDPRLTQLGCFLRKFSLDELPQLINILKREMSLVGPRIISPVELPLYGRWGNARLSVLPGLTGWWQVNGRCDTSYDQRVALDMAYIREWSIWFDLWILLLTIPAILGHEGAY